MAKKINYRKELEKARKAVQGLERTGNPETIDAYWEVCCGDVLLAEDILKEQHGQWEITALAKELIDIATYLEEFDHMIDNLHSALSRMADAIFDHPSLKLKVLQLELSVLRRIEVRTGHELGIAEDVSNEISLYGRNIQYADNGRFDRIEQIGHLKRDPIEWSAEYESVIDEAEKKIYKMLKRHPRGMGFCFAYWHAKAQVLKEDYGIEWRSPAIMNPGVMFD